MDGIPSLNDDSCATRPPTLPDTHPISSDRVLRPPPDWRSVNTGYTVPMKTRTHNDRARHGRSHSVYLTYFDRTARQVSIVGSFNQWDPNVMPMTSNGAGEWSIELTLAPGVYEYQYSVEGRWINDPQAVRSTLSPCGGRNSILTVE